jgi:hypothetical protein
MSVASAERLAKDLKALEEELSNKTESLKREYEKKMKDRLEAFQKETFSTLTSLNVKNVPKEKEEREEQDEDEESDESGSFILEDDDDDEIPDEEDEDDLPPPVHYKMKPVTKKRTRGLESVTWILLKVSERTWVWKETMRFPTSCGTTLPRVQVGGFLKR